MLTSDETIRELQDPGYPEDKRARCLALVAGVPRLAVNAEILDLAGYYIQERIMPSGDPGDALHLAFASWYRIQYSLTWNYRHLANANKFRRIEVLNGRRGLASPLLVSPAQLLGINYA
jgi:predicted nucleic acid-binding protein